MRRSAQRPTTRPRRRRRLLAHSETGSSRALRYRGDRGDNVRVRGAATQVAAHALADLIPVECDDIDVEVGAHHARPAFLRFAQHCDGGDDLTRSAIAALEGIVLDKRALQRVHLAVVPETRGRDDLRTIVSHRQWKTADDAASVEQNRTRAALP